VVDLYSTVTTWKQRSLPLASSAMLQCHALPCMAMLYFGINRSTVFATSNRTDRKSLTYRTKAAPLLKIAQDDSKPTPLTPYQEIIGCLQWLAGCTRPDISFAASYLARGHPRRHRPLSRLIETYLAVCYGAIQDKHDKHVGTCGALTSSWRRRAERERQSKLADYCQETIAEAGQSPSM
jgi:hypothetical protein